MISSIYWYSEFTNAFSWLNEVQPEITLGSADGRNDRYCTFPPIFVHLATGLRLLFDSIGLSSPLVGYGEANATANAAHLRKLHLRIQNEKILALNAGIGSPNTHRKGNLQMGEITNT